MSGDIHIVAWLAGYVIAGCAIALASLLYTKPEKLSFPRFALAHALWPLSLAMIVLTAVLSSHGDKRQRK